MKPISLLACGALLLGGCVTSMPMSLSTPAIKPAAEAAGRPPKLSSGTHMAYWVWKDEDAVWHLRTTSANVRHRFEGIVHPLPGTAIVSLDAIQHERRDEIGLIGGDINIHFMPRQNIDGVDFRLSGPDALEFDLRIDNDGDPTHIFIGQNERQPASAHFILSP